MNLRKLHKLTGLVLLLPFIAWALTAVFFLVRPGYDQAYERLSVMQYPLVESYQVNPEPDWLEARYFHTILGEHLLVTDGSGVNHLEANTLEAFPYPDDGQLTELVEDAFRANPDRYGRVARIEEGTIYTDTGVIVRFDWDSLSFSQNGRDTRWIDRIYNVHYLQWTGIDLVDRTWGLFGLFLLIFITYTGGRMALGLNGDTRRDSLQSTNDEMSV